MLLPLNLKVTINFVPLAVIPIEDQPIFHVKRKTTPVDCPIDAEDDQHGLLNDFDC